jgi:methylenetetrahydrofolate dehydrogenase (NADP+) / methenyltetrahydrofolate cyclohydrolase
MLYRANGGTICYMTVVSPQPVVRRYLRLRIPSRRDEPESLPTGESILTAAILDGKALSREIQSEIAQQVAQFAAQTGVKPCLAAVLVGENPASQVYVRSKQKGCEKVGMTSQLHRLPPEASSASLFSLIERLNCDTDVHGILVQLPLPKGIDEAQILEAVSPVKDVDAFHPDNVGRIVQGRPRFLPCTPHGIQQMLVRRTIKTVGANVVVVGRSDIVGKPMAMMLMQRGKDADATVTVCHSHTNDLPAVTGSADILIVAIGKARFLTADMVKPGAVVVDVGINRTDAGLVGDVDLGVTGLPLCRKVL